VFVSVGDAGNAADTNGRGAVSNAFNIGTFEVTAAQYCEFLNAVAKADTCFLYNENMSQSQYGCKIARVGTPGNYSYSVAFDRRNRPVNYVDWGDAARFCNWLQNGQPTGTQNSATTEDGSYYLNGATTEETLMAVARKTDARYFIPTEDEWYKAAYYDPTLNSGTGGYWLFPTQSSNTPTAKAPPGDAEPPGSANWYNNNTFVDTNYYMTVVGAYAPSPSPYGTFDQGGNISEWNESKFDANNRVIRGGNFGHLGTELASMFREGWFPTKEDEIYGFRVASIPEPSSLGLWAASLLAVGYGFRQGRKANR